MHVKPFQYTFYEILHVLTFIVNYFIKIFAPGGIRTHDNGLHDQCSNHWATEAQWLCEFLIRVKGRDVNRLMLNRLTDRLTV